MVKLGDTVLYTPKALDGIPNTDLEKRAAMVTKVNYDGTYDLQVFWRNQVKPVLGVEVLPTPNGTFETR